MACGLHRSETGLSPILDMLGRAKQSPASNRPQRPEEIASSLACWLVLLLRPATAVIGQRRLPEPFLAMTG
jgi:hypothetical protein